MISCLGHSVTVTIKAFLVYSAGMFTTSFRREIYKWSQKVKVRVFNRKTAITNTRKPPSLNGPAAAFV